MVNKGVDMGDLAFSTGRARYHIKDEDLDNLVEDACHQIGVPIFNLLANTSLKKPFMYWLFPNYHMVIAINAQDFR